MKITEITAIGLAGATPETGWAQGTDAAENMHTLLRVQTDGGIEGWGSAFNSEPLISGALELLRPHLIGQSAHKPEQLTETLHTATFWQGRGGAVTHAISGINIALWDIFGKVTGFSVGRLLGGPYRDKVRPYGSLLFDDPPILKDKIQAATARGFKALKLGWNGFGRVSPKYDELLVKTAREAAGDDAAIMVDAGGSEQFWPHGYKWALKTAHMLADYAVTWFEEPLPPDDIEGYIKLTERAPLPIAAGEVLTRRQSFWPWIEKHAVDIVQPDTTKCGGLSEARHIGWMAHQLNIRIVPHGWNTAVGLAADLQLAACLPVCDWVEYISPSAYVDGIVTTPFTLDSDGMLEIPDKPGLGIELDLDAIARFSRKK